MLGGIGFTMSLFIGTLAFASATRAGEVCLGVLAGSVLSASAGYLALRLWSSETKIGPDRRPAC
jgi:NhaA family Na+:H+ antiporter